MATEKKLKNIATIRIKTDLEKPMDYDLIAENIKSVADSYSKALESGLSKRCIAVLINDAMPSKNKVSITDIQNVLVWASNLRIYTTK